MERIKEATQAVVDAHKRVDQAASDPTTPRTQTAADEVARDAQGSA